MALNRQNSISAGRLRAAVDSVLIPGDAEPDPQAEALLRQYAAGALRHILDRQDPPLLAAEPTHHWFVCVPFTKPMRTSADSV